MSSTYVQRLTRSRTMVQNRPRPLREFDQIYMKAGDMVMQGEFIARWAKGKRLAFIGDGDAISVCTAYLHHREILTYGPSKVVVYDFDERICQAVKRFADSERLENLDAELYNCLEPFPGPTNFDCFYTNPPWGASNDGESVNVFVQRGMEAVGYDGEGIAVVADDPELEWPKRVLANLQGFALSHGFFVQRMMPQVHSYHLDDAPDLRSCNVLLKAMPGNSHRADDSRAIDDPARLENFYGRDNPPRVRYVRERALVGYGKAPPGRVRARTGGSLMTEIVHQGAGVVFMKVGTHAREPLTEIIARKQQEIEDAGYALWGYGGNTCHPLTSVQPFARDFIRRDGVIYLVMHPMASRHFAVPQRAEELSSDGVDWEEIPPAINVRGSRYALAIDSLEQEAFELPLSQTRVAVGNSLGRRGDRYIQGRVDKACLEIVEDPAEPEDEAPPMRIELVARLVEPYAVLLR